MEDESAKMMEPKSHLRILLENKEKQRNPQLNQQYQDQEHPKLKQHLRQI
jgi:hypothetical protein